MQPLPHQYRVCVRGKPDNNLSLYAEHLPTLEVAPPAEFDGPGDQWSPEELFMASIANCFVLSFRAIAKAAKVEWSSIECESQGTLEKADKTICFTQIRTKARLFIPAAQNIDDAENALDKAEKSCFVTNSLSCPSHLEYKVSHTDT